MLDQATGAIGFAPSALWITLATLIGIGTIALLVMNLISKYRELRSPKMAEGKTVEEKLKSDHERLTKLEETTAKQDEELKLILRSQMDIIHHMVDGNGLVSLKQTQKDIEHFLITGKVRREE